jgi:hypothetical protein
VSQQNPSDALPPQQPQQSFGAAQQPQQSFGAAPGAPGGPGAPGAPGAQGVPGPPGAPAPGTEAFGSAPEEPKPKKKNPFVRIGISLAVLAAIAAGGWWLSRDDAVKAEVGQCLAGTTPEQLNADDLKIVDCTASDAGFKVVQRVEGKTYAESNNACTDEQTEFVFWSGKEGAAGTTLCLARTAP